MNSKMTTNSLQSTTEPKTKTKQNKNKLSKHLEKEQNYRNEDHMRVTSGEGVGREWGRRYRE